MLEYDDEDEYEDEDEDEDEDEEEDDYRTPRQKSRKVIKE